MQVYYHGFEETPNQGNTQAIMDCMFKKINSTKASLRKQFNMPPTGDYQVFGEGSLSDAGELIIVVTEGKPLT